MTISLRGLDLGFMKANPLPPREPKPRPDFSNRAENIAIPYFVGDIAPFISIATRDPTLISSRSQLRAYERANDIRQCGDLKGKIVPEQKKRAEQQRAISEADKKAVDFKWVD